MSSFVALNIEPEDDSEDEIDDSKEIQIEEALKLYQFALKLHSQGPAFYDEAETAYRNLFASEVFTYPESLVEPRPHKLLGGAEFYEDIIEDSAVAASAATTPGNDGAPSTLPQVLYLSYKNHGQFLLDRLKHHILQTYRGYIPDNTKMIEELDDLSSATSSSLRLFTEALDRDETDLELWRQVSRIGEFLGSKRIAKFCLEAVLDTDRVISDAWTEPLNLDQIFATEQLKDLLEEMQDYQSESSLSASPKKYGDLLKGFMKNLNLYPFLPSPRQYRLAELTSQRLTGLHVEAQEIQVPHRTWASCGQSILFHLSQKAQGLAEPPAGARYSLVLPSKHGSTGANVRAKPRKRGKGSLCDSLGEGPPTVDNQMERSNGPLDSPVEFMVNPELDPAKVTACNGQFQHNHSSGLSREAVKPALLDGKEREILEIGAPTIEAEAHTARTIEVGSQPPSPVETSKTGEPLSLPTRKRSSDSAGLQDNVDSGRTKSKRIKARGSLNEILSKEASLEDKAQYYKDQLQVYTQADHWLFEVFGGILAKAGIESLRSLATLREALSTPYYRDISACANFPPSLEDVAAQDLNNILNTWDMEKSCMFLQGDSLDEPVISTSGPRNSGLTVFLEHSKRGSQIASQRPHLSDDHGLQEFAEATSQSWTFLDQLSLRWIGALLSPRPRKEDPAVLLPSMYEAYLWSDKLKETVVQVLVTQDEFIYSSLSSRTKSLYQDLQDNRSRNNRTGLQRTAQDLIETVQNIFELHLDIYGRITNPSSEVDFETRALQLDRLGRWAALASDVINTRTYLDADSDKQDSLSIRFLWSSVLFTSLIDPASRDHIVACFRDLKGVLEASGNPRIEVQNNAIMPEISIEAAEREITRLTTMDFFLSVFNSEKSHPLTVIESLEPILERSIRKTKTLIDNGPRMSDTKPGDLSETEEAILRGNGIDTSLTGFPNSRMEQMLQFLDRASVSLKLFLWRKLGDAYEAIDYPPQVLSCSLRSIQMIMEYLQSTSFITSASQNRQLSLVRWLRTLDNLTTKALGLVLYQPQFFDFVDETHLKSSIAALAALQRILYVFVFWEDSIRVGRTRLPTQSNSPATTAYNTVLIKFRDMLVRVWTLQYTLLKEAATQKVDFSVILNEELLDYLKLVHHALGLRSYCKFSNKIFLKCMKAELLRLDHSESSENDLAQLIFDLHGVKISPNPANIEDHGCPSAPLDRETAVEILDLFMNQVRKINLKDIIKSELRATIDKMQQAIKVPKPTPSMTFNRRLFNNFIKSPIKPMDLYRSLRGIGDLCGALVTSESSAVADKGWYFLVGHLALIKFRSQKRSNSGPMDDLDIASAFFRQEFELGLEKWETWYRLAQVYDSKIEEDVAWNAEKLNNKMEDLKGLQRSGINCYTMAVAIATRSADTSFETASKISDLYTDFAMRIYASSREPFSMQAFSLVDFSKDFNGQTRGMYKDLPFRELGLYSAWRFACTLLRRASVHKSQSWMNSYMLGKCLWKMYNCSAEVRGRAPKIGFVHALEAFTRAIKLLPERRDNRHPEKQPTLEPHYKLVSVIHKLVQARRLRPKTGCEYLKATSYSRKIPPVQDLEEWEGYLIRILRALRSADKANWHHRMVARAAHAIYDDSPTDIMAALGAKHELTQQIFTKTMQIQVWRPDNERAGRHFVYTSRYVNFFIRLLDQLNDRTSMEALAKRNRKRSGDFFNHTKVWESVCMAYLKLLRRQGPILENHEDLIFKTLSPETFHTNTARLETWAHSTPPPTSPLLDLLRETIELKRLNGTLMKPGPIEDLIGDIYALLYDTIVPDLVARSATEENRSRMRVDHVLMSSSSNFSNNPYAPTNPPPSLLLPPADAEIAGLIPVTTIITKPRAKGINRREIQRKAENLATTKPLPLQPPSSSSASATAIANKPGNNSTTKILTAVAIPSGYPDPQLLAVREDPVGREGSSVPGSLHDSADDESELSEVGEGEGEGKGVECRGEEEEEEEEDAAEEGKDRGKSGRVMFPGLLVRGGEETGKREEEGVVDGEGDGGGGGDRNE